MKSQAKRSRKSKVPMFERSTPPPRAQKDDAGKVRVSVFLCSDYGYHAPGNITRAFTIKHSKVSAVGDAIELALFE